VRVWMKEQESERQRGEEGGCKRERDSARGVRGRKKTTEGERHVHVRARMRSARACASSVGRKHDLKVKLTSFPRTVIEILLDSPPVFVHVCVS